MGQTFHGPQTIIAKSRSTSYYTISFKPTKAIETNGLLTLNNLATSQKYVYDLKGIGQEPLPEDHVDIEANVRDTVGSSQTI